jgi:hypothetical protein
MTSVLPEVRRGGERTRTGIPVVGAPREQTVGVDAAVQAPPSTPGWITGLKPLVRPSGYFVASRLAVVFAVLASKWLVPKLHPLKVLGTGWDAQWYTKIAQFGYPHRIFNEDFGSRWAFFPGFPAFIRATAEVTRLSITDAAVLDAAIFGLTSAIALWLAIREVFGPTIADRSVLLYAFFPAAYVLSMGYSEGLFLTASAGCLFALSRRYWITASLLAVLGSLTKNFGVILIVCVVVAAVPYILREHKLRPLAAVLIAPSGFIAWLGFSWAETGNPLAFLKAEQIWGNGHFTWFLAPLFAVTRLLTNFHNFANASDVLAAIGFVFAYVGLAILWRTRSEGIDVPSFWWVYTIGSVLAMASPNVLQSILRYSMAVFPLFAAYAWKIRKTWEGALVGCMGMMQGALALVVFVDVLHELTAMVVP